MFSQKNNPINEMWSFNNIINSIKSIAFFWNATEQQTFLQSIFNYSITIGFITFVVMGILTIIAITVIVCSKIIKNTKITENDQTAKLPAIYNNHVNFNIWIKDMNNYLDTNGIINDKQKQETLLKRLDSTSQAMVRNLIKEKKIKNYKDLINYLQTSYINPNISCEDNILKFNNRTQQPHESLYKFYTHLQELVLLAYPDAPEGFIENAVKKQFIKGLCNTTVQSELLLNHSQDSNILASAVNAQLKLAFAPQSTIPNSNRQSTSSNATINRNINDHSQNTQENRNSNWNNRDYNNNNRRGSFNNRYPDNNHTNNSNHGQRQSNFHQQSNTINNVTNDDVNNHPTVHTVTTTSQQ